MLRIVCWSSLPEAESEPATAPWPPGSWRPRGDGPRRRLPPLSPALSTWPDFAGAPPGAAPSVECSPLSRKDPCGDAALHPGAGARFHAPGGSRWNWPSSVPADCPGAELQEAISRRYGTGELSVDGSPLAGLRSVIAPLGNGAVLVDGAAVRTGRPGRPGTRRRPAAAPLFLAVHSGPGAGTIVPLRRGRFRIGRSGTDIVLPGRRAVPRTCAAGRLGLGGDRRGSAQRQRNRVDGERVRRAVVTTGSVIRCGNSTMSLIFGGDFAASGSSGRRRPQRRRAAPRGQSRGRSHSGSSRAPCC